MSHASARNLAPPPPLLPCGQCGYEWTTHFCLFQFPFPFQFLFLFRVHFHTNVAVKTATVANVRTNWAHCLLVFYLRRIVYVFGISRLWSRCDIDFDAVLMRHSNFHRRINLQPIVMFVIVKNQMWIPPSAFAYHAWWQLRSPERSSIGGSIDQVTAWQLQSDGTSVDWRLQHSLTINVEQCGCLSTPIMQSYNWEREKEDGELETASHRQVELGTSFILIIISSGILAPPFDACCGRFVSSSSSSSSTDWIT